MKLLHKVVGVFVATVLSSNAWTQPANDEIQNAELLPPFDGTVSGTTIGSTFDNVGFVGTSNTAPGVWYRTTGTGGDVTFSTCNQASYDTKLTAFRGTVAAPLGITGNDDFAGCAGFTSEIRFTSVLNEDLWVLVHGFGSSTGTFSLSFSSSAPLPPPPPPAVAVPTSTPVLLLSALVGLLGLQRIRRSGNTWRLKRWRL